MSWQVLVPELRGHALCLQRLALRNGYRVGELCVELECDRRYLYEVFDRDMGLSPKKWMRQERMVVARRLLTGGRTQDDVAELLGFSSRNNFRREFLFHHLVGPQEFQSEQLGGDL